MLLTAREAAQRLGIKLDTLYAYVSRGRLRSVAVPGSRQRRYRVEEVEALRGAALPTSRPTETEALTPVIASSICLIENGRVFYRGEDAIALSHTATLEDVAGLLWQAGPAVSSPPATAAAPADRTAAVGFIERCQTRLAMLADRDLPALDLTRSGLIRTGRLIVRELAACLVPGRVADQTAPVHAQLAAAWQLDQGGADLVRRCLVLLADHELNASTFVARCVASTGATPYAVVTAALAALSGRRHGGASARAEALFGELARDTDPLAAMAARLARGEDLPGFGHFLYPAGDPRAKAMLDAVGVAVPATRGAIEAAVAAGTRLTGQLPNVDFALAAAATALQLPANSALGLFVIGRTVGWIAHAIEQYESDVLIRPRARYTGPRPAPDSG
ncbi:MAG: citrate synthase family protein [Alphaproteobacteria bacterium]|nr:citrate synthase family protein [Alphaproteobacteria bacterium]